MTILLGDRTITLNQAALEELLNQAQQQGECIYQNDGIETQVNLPHVLGEGCGRSIQLRHGLTLHIRDAKLRHSVAVEQHYDATFPVTAKFYLSGASRVKMPRVAEMEPDEEISGHHYLSRLPNLIKIEEWQANVPIQLVMIHAHADYFRTFSCTDSLPDLLQTLMQGSGRFHQSLGKMSPAIVQILQQIIHCPYQGTTQQLYLESKALELFALQFACLESKLPTLRKQTLPADDLERLHSAKDLLVQYANNPPSLLELARQVGLNDRKLKQGFRQVFGTTVFGYLHDYRMQQAQDLLQQSQLTIAQVAATIGYRNPEAFSTAFRRRFAVSPKAYQLGHRG
ncbi:MAG: helix-turn-helix transcriptional regulator [Oscillatoriophycideae cyanobacterium NC_groundwater_1537_Pr4_S-0.65um_50_18]|nr:helix-turn-helix transcriptional regulator [Oscillatoriophycideae cyanobacterium NC_groundwater_1537_Pr4_S-0.65um_50_18]